jgi:hypothetical protein
MFDEAFERHRARMHSKTMAYRGVFRVQAAVAAPWWKFWAKRADQPLTQVGETVLRDLARYCYAGRPTLTVSIVTRTADPIAMAFAEGRRDVFNHIVSILNLSDNDIERIAHRRSSNDE